MNALLNPNLNTEHSQPVSERGFIGEFSLSEQAANLPVRPIAIEPQPAISNSAFVAVQLLDHDEQARLVEEAHGQAWVTVGHNGIFRDYQRGQIVGSYRASTFSEPLAESLWARLQPALPEVRSFDQQDSTDWDGHSAWAPVGVNPLFRLINYQPGGLLVPHYDAPIDLGDKRSLMSLVIYLECSPTVIGGATRFLNDQQDQLPLQERDWSDRVALAREDEVKVAIAPIPGNGLVFDHRLLHDSEQISGQGTKLIMRSDLLFSRV